MKIITSGEKYIDIDALACCVAYNEYLTLKGAASEVVIVPDFNGCVGVTKRLWMRKELIREIQKLK